ncbi:TonB family protein [Telluria mixta]|uniref:TonB family protein n=1 Tax=Telluria mixta TaxID=34071 RepID=A0ABT2BXE6_9BURK|nr:energy transducer TonB [Telluria mixta]MCS0629104.1 TonB family protein [Telluria mixta]WEM97548.1 TonB family protein [Telluria mixta]
MQFTSLSSDNRPNAKAAKFALIAAVHVVVGTVFVHSINTKAISLSKLPEQVLVMIEPERPTPPPPPPEPPKPAQQLAPPNLVVPKTEVPVAPPPLPDTVTATTASDPSPFPAMPSDPVPEAPATPSANPGQMRTAVFADASGCALPAYPTAAARDGVTGTSTLALLVGTDGRVSSARIEHSSGSRVLDSAALNALSLCKFKPATNNGVPEAGWAKLAFVWTLD